MSNRAGGPVSHVIVLVVLLLVVVPAPTRTVVGEAVVQLVAGPNPTVAAAIADVSLERLYTDLYALQNFSTRYVYGAGIVGASQYIYDRFAENPALQVSFQDFTVQGTPMRNVIAVLPGLDPTNETLYVVGGHYDSISFNSDPMTWAPGADDDGSGTVGVIEAARVLSRYRFNATLVFAAWTAEEIGLVGSDYYCTCLAGSYGKVGLNLNLDMIGNDPSDTQAIYAVHDLSSEWAADAFLTVVNDYGLGLWAAKAFDTTPNSDHASFWAQGYPAIFLAEADFSPNWHTSTDTVDNVNMYLVTNTTQGAVGFLATLAGIQEPGLGAVYFDGTAYGVVASAEITLEDADLNTNPGLVELAAVGVASPQEPAGEIATLTETGPDTGRFRGTLPLGPSPSVPGELQVAPGATITVSYADASPSGTRTDSATIDGTFPVIRNLAVVPSITTATVSWETSEPTDATLLYGPSPALGLTWDDSRLSATHRVELAGLQPDTLYYFDVSSADAAGQTAVADNGGAHFGFHTLTGIAAIPGSGRVGYVRSGADPQPNFFGSDRMLSGYSGATGRTYRAAAQFDTSGAPIPVGAAVTGALLDLYGQEWVYAGAGQWSVQYLNGSIDANWQTHTYAAISGAAVDFQIPPTLANADLRPGEWRSLSIPAGQLGIVRDRVNTGAVSIRIDGPTGLPSRIFAWSTGYPAPCAPLPATHPRLSVMYSISGDVTGPQVTELGADPNPTMTAPTTTLRATVSDALTGGTPIANTEFFLGADPGVGRGTAMGAADGAFDAPTEDAVFELDVTGIPPGTYSLGVRGRDGAGNWGLPNTLDLYVGVFDFFPPVVTVSGDPDPAPPGAVVTITANVTDDVGVAQVDAAITNPGGSLTIYPTMTKVGADYVYSQSYTEIGTWTYDVVAVDTSGKTGSANGTFMIADLTPPAISGLAATPDPGEILLPVNVSATIVDDSAVAAAMLNVTGPDGAWQNVTMDRTGDVFFVERPYALVGTYSIALWAVDTYGNGASASGSFLVEDRTPPVVSAVADPPSQTVGGFVAIRAQAQDNDRIAGVVVEVRNPAGASVGTYAMSYDGANGEYVYDFQATAVGNYSFVVTASDPSANEATASGTFLSVDAVGPTVDALFVDPPLAELGLETYVGAIASDDVGVVAVTFAVYDAASVLVGNFSAAFNASAGRWELKRAYAAGSYSVIAWAEDAGGNVASRSGAFSVGAGDPPQADAGPDVRIERGQSATLNGSGSTDDVGITRWEWTVTGPDGTQTFATPVATFSPSAAGAYTATLRVWDAAGRMDEDTALITVVEPPASGAVDWTWPVILPVLLLAVLILVVLWRRRKKQERPPPEEPA